ncbi:MAG: alpha/beta hydrolase fold domain-containing protein [Planctomycetota bacterium]|jgi:acetyl esterase/lipase
MKWHHTVRGILVFAVVVTLWNEADGGQQDDRTSENTPQLKTLLERRPETDLNRDGVLTMEEAQQARRQMQNARQKQAAQRKTRAGATRKPAPTHADVPYGDHERHVVDFWQAKSDKPTPLFVWIHGGGFRGGDKASIPPDLLRGCLEAGISCASINYRLSHHAPYPAQMHDSARAIQFLRTKADSWNLDAKRLAAGGGSAGSGISQWIGFHDDMAQPKSENPVSRQSTRLTCVFPINMQSTYDPREIKRIVPGDAYKHPALVPLFGRPEGWDWDTGEIDEALDQLLRDASPIHHLTEDDPPVFLIHYERSNTPGNIHHSNFGKHLKDAMDKLRIECIQCMDSDYESMAAAYADMVQFMKKHFKM